MDSDGSGVPASLRAYDDYCASSVTPFLAICVKLGADCAEVSKLVEKMFAQQRGVIETATKCKEPDQAGLKDVFGGVVATMKEINASVRRNAMENNVKTISEGMQALNWMVVRPAPVDFMTSYIDGSDMWSNRIRKEFKGVNEDQISFCVLFKTMMNELRAYVKEHHTTGLTWNPKGVAVAEYAGASAPSIAVAAPVTAAVKSAPAPAHAEGPVKSGLFSALAQGEGVTSGLKKVTKDQQTWRAEFNKDAAVPVVSAAPKKAAEAAGPKKSAVATGEPKFALQGDKWVKPKWL
jgi:adenylyl cyclase-associated protein